MIGFSVTGHGSFATGLTNGLKLLAAAKKQMVCFVAPSNDDIDCEYEEL